MKIVVLASHTKSLFWFRLDMMKDFVGKGHQVMAVGSDPECEWENKFRENHIKYKQLNVERNGLNIFKDVITFIGLYKVLKDERPDKIFVYQAKTIIFGAVAARLCGITEVFVLIAGLGSVFRGSTFKSKILKSIISRGYRLSCNFSKKVFLQNKDDKRELISAGIVDEKKIVILNGSGVNLQEFSPVPFPVKPAFLFIGRLIKDKGVIEYLEACRIIKEKHKSIRCLLVGPFDSNPSSMKKSELQQYIDAGVVEYFGEQSDVRPYIAQATVLVLPSYHEGTPKTVLEAMAMGRAIITSNAPGCRETVEEGGNGFLVPVKDITGIVARMEQLLNDSALCKKMGLASLKKVADKYDVRKVNRSIMTEMGLV